MGSPFRVGWQSWLAELAGRVGWQSWLADRPKPARTCQAPALKPPYPEKVRVGTFPEIGRSPRPPAPTAPAPRQPLRGRRRAAATARRGRVLRIRRDRRRGG